MLVCVCVCCEQNAARAIVCLLVFGFMCNAHQIACDEQFEERGRETCALHFSVGENYEYNY